MNWKLALLALLICLLATEIMGVKRRKFKKYRHGRKPVGAKTTTTTTTTTEAPVEEEEDMYSMMDEDDKVEEEEEEEDNEEGEEDEEVEEEEEQQQREEEYEENEIPGGYDVLPVDPCVKHHCGAGKECAVNENGDAECVCVTECRVEVDPRRKVCSNHNETWNSDCELYKMRCLCNREDEQCTDEKYNHAHVEYFGECREIPECTVDEMADFPRRMRDWLFNIMRDLADRQELSSYYLQLEREAEEDLSHKWSNAAIWKWCDLDGHPLDRKVSRHELFPIRAPLMYMEHCIAPFLDSCDYDGDHYITLHEWGQCLELDVEEIEDKCEKISNNEE